MARFCSSGAAAQKGMEFGPDVSSLGREPGGLVPNLLLLSLAFLVQKHSYLLVKFNAYRKGLAAWTYIGMKMRQHSCPHRVPWLEQRSRTGSQEGGCSVIGF